MSAFTHRVGWSCCLMGWLVCWTSISMAQEIERISPPEYRPPTRAQWLAARLDPNEYNTAVRFEVSLDAWKDMDSRRHNHIVAGWACISTALLGTAVGGTVYYAADIDFQAHPEQEVTIVAAVAAGALLLTGIVLASTAPGPEEFRRAWFMKHGGVAGEGFSPPQLALAPNGFSLRF